MSKLNSDSQGEVLCRNDRCLTKDSNKVLHRVGCVDSDSL